MAMGGIWKPLFHLVATRDLWNRNIATLQQRTGTHEHFGEALSKI